MNDCNMGALNYGRRNMHERFNNLALVSNLYSYLVV